MKKNIIQKTCLALVLGVTILAPAFVRAGGNMGQKIATFEPLKSGDTSQPKPGDTVVKVCRDCGAVIFVRVEKPGKGVYDFTAKKCELCGSENTYIGATKEFIPFKERVKR